MLIIRDNNYCNITRTCNDDKYFSANNAKIFRVEEKYTMVESATILYIEDNPDNRLLVRRVLLAENYNVLDADNAYQALEILQSCQPDLILMDINLPEIDGYTLTARLKELPDTQNIPIVALTANVMKGDRERTFEAGCDGYIQKPVNVDTLPNQIASFLETAR
jgi:two-component system cell cycle response regulator DivK